MSVSPQISDAIKGLTAAGYISTFCAVCNTNVSETLEDRAFHEQTTGHKADLARRNGALVRRITPLGEMAAEKGLI